MKDAPIYPIIEPQQPLYHASYVHNAVYIPAIQQFDPTNVWLSSPGLTASRIGNPARRRGLYRGAWRWITVKVGFWAAGIRAGPPG